jgi:NAD-dependent dihydropyrimidine dehydrogenase PreA subunit
MIRRLRGFDAWLLVADSKGVNVWCAAGGNEFNTHSVVSAVKTTGIADLVDHRTLILPPLGAPGIRAKDVKDQTGWSVRWGPVRAEDIPLYLDAGQRRNEKMKRVTYDGLERLDTAVGSLFPFFFLGAIGFLLFGRHLLLDYLVVGIVSFIFFMLACPWLPGKRGLTKAIFVDVLLGILLIVYEVSGIQSTLSIRADLIIAMVMMLLYGTELGGLASTMPSDLDPFLARLGVGAIGNVAFAGTIRTELLNGFRVLKHDRDHCIGCRNCTEVCPQNVWHMDEKKRAVPAHMAQCTACRACLVQCESDAIKAEPVSEPLQMDPATTLREL